MRAKSFLCLIPFLLINIISRWSCSSQATQCSVSKTCNWQFIRWKNKSHIWFLPTLKNDHVQSLKQTDLFNEVMNISLGGGGTKPPCTCFSFYAAFLPMFCSLSKQRGSLSCSRHPVFIHIPAASGCSSRRSPRANNWILPQRIFELETCPALSGSEAGALKAEMIEAADGGTPWNLLKALFLQAKTKSTTHPSPSERTGKCILGGTALGVRINPPRCPWWQSSPIWSIQQHY